MGISDTAALLRTTTLERPGIAKHDLRAPRLWLSWASPCALPTPRFPQPDLDDTQLRTFTESYPGLSCDNGSLEPQERRSQRTRGRGREGHHGVCQQDSQS